MRTRYRQDSETGKLVEIIQQKPKAIHAIHVMDPFVSHVDGSTIRNSQDLKNHNRQHNVSNDPDLLKEQVARSNNRTHEVGTKKERVAHILDAIERTQSSGFHRHVQYED
tara:strand:- start:630 stop:959 length:330 start_codon:yes stop_codon:yes gene_type:complete